MADRQSGWLIEAAINDGRPYYLVPEAYGHGIPNRFAWKPTHVNALRFARQEDGQRLLDIIRHTYPDLFPPVVPFPRVTEHIWYGGEMFHPNMAPADHSAQSQDKP